MEEDNEFYKRLLNAAINGGPNDGRLLLHEIASLLSDGYDQGLSHGLLPKEYVKYLADALFSICDSPTEADKILKISKPPNRESPKNILYDGAIAYLCLKESDTISAIPDKLPGKVFTYVAAEIEHDYKKFLKKLPTFKEGIISDATVRRAYNRAYPTIKKFKNIEGYKWVLKLLNNELEESMRNDMTVGDHNTLVNLMDEISNWQGLTDSLNMAPKSDAAIKQVMTDAMLELPYKDDNT